MSDDVRPGAACAVTPRDRAVRGVLSLAAAGIAWATADQLWYAVPAAVAATFLAIGAVTGWCPTALFTGRHAPAAIGTEHGYPDARAIVHLSGRSSREGSRR